LSRGSAGCIPSTFFTASARLADFQIFSLARSASQAEPSRGNTGTRVYRTFNEIDSQNDFGTPGTQIYSHVWSFAYQSLLFYRPPLARALSDTYVDEISKLTSGRCGSSSKSSNSCGSSSKSSNFDGAWTVRPPV
jgi:hypothetical protein